MAGLQLAKATRATFVYKLSVGNKSSQMSLISMVHCSAMLPYIEKNKNVINEGTLVCVRQESRAIGPVSACPLPKDLKEEIVC